MTLKNFEQMLVFSKNIGVQLVNFLRKRTPCVLFLRDFGKVSRGCFCRSRNMLSSCFLTKAIFPRQEWKNILLKFTSLFLPQVIQFIIAEKV